MGDTLKIQKPHIIFCEGRDAWNFLISFLNCQELKSVPFLSRDIQVMDFGGNEELRQKLEVLRLSPGFSALKSLLIVRDAEKNAEGAVSQIKNSLKSVGLPVPAGPGEWAVSEEKGQKVGFLLFPTCDKDAQSGTLEDLCLAILKPADHAAMLEEIQDFLGSLKERRQLFLRHEHKTKLHTYFSITDGFVGMKIGEAARAQAFDWNSEKLNFLKGFLIELEDSKETE